MEKRIKNKKFAINFMLIVLLLLFPLRHAGWGLDLWDTGYNYTNYTYASPRHMGVMWWFSTYLTNLIGHVFTLLPFGDTLLGMNLYTGLLVGAISVLGYCFCTKKLGISPVCGFVGEMAALCLCWCPSAKLYDYLTYLFLLLCVIFLYEGLTEQKKPYLILAGVCLGSNLFVRFSNLTEAALILGVWGYAVLEGLERHRREGAPWLRFSFSRAVGYTAWCIAGYLLPLLFGFGWIAIRYGIGEYVGGIKLLFSMTEQATDYKASSMLKGLIWPFWEGKYWMFRILLFVVAASLIAFAADYAPLCLKQQKKNARLAETVGKVCSVCMAVVMVYWLLSRQQPHFTSFLYETYDPIYWPAVMFLVLAMGIGAVCLLKPNTPIPERFLGGMMILILLLTSLGSNNGIYPSFNNLFLAAPYVLWQLAYFTRWACRRAKKKPEQLSEFRLNFMPAALLAWAFVLLLLFEFGMFGLRFAFYEGTGIKEHRYEVENNRVLKNIGMPADRAVWMREISAFAEERGLAGQEVILYGWIPALSFYLEMPPAISSWSDLDSYQLSTMRKDLGRLTEEIDRGDARIPVVIVGIDEEKKESEVSGSDDPKWQLIQEFLGKYDYRKTFENQKFVIWQAE